MTLRTAPSGSPKPASRPVPAGCTQSSKPAFRQGPGRWPRLAVLAGKTCLFSGYKQPVAASQMLSYATYGCRHPAAVTVSTRVHTYLSTHLVGSVARMMQSQDDVLKSSSRNLSDGTPHLAVGQMARVGAGAVALTMNVANSACPTLRMT